MNWYLRKDLIYVHIGRFLHLDITNPWKEMKKLRNVFVPLESHICFGRPPFWDYRLDTRCLFEITAEGVDWKDKWNTPRIECYPVIYVRLFGLAFSIFWKLPPHLDRHWLDLDNYWEQALWYLYYNDKDVIKARDTWPWMKDDESSWRNYFLVNNAIQEGTTESNMQKV